MTAVTLSDNKRLTADERSDPGTRVGLLAVSLLQDDLYKTDAISVGQFNQKCFIYIFIFVFSGREGRAYECVNHN